MRERIHQNVLLFYYQFLRSWKFLNMNQTQDSEQLFRSCMNQLCSYIYIVQSLSIYATTSLIVPSPIKTESESRKQSFFICSKNNRPSLLRPKVVSYKVWCLLQVLINSWFQFGVLYKAYLPTAGFYCCYSPWLVALTRWKHPICLSIYPYIRGMWRIHTFPSDIRELQTVSSRIWNRVVDFISFGGNMYSLPCDDRNELSNGTKFLSSFSYAHVFIYISKF